MSNFNEFLQEFFPRHPSKKSRNLEEIYKKICENNMLTDIFINKINTEDVNDKKIFLSLYRNKFVKVLLYIGLNDIDSINYCIRSSVEYLLKFLFSVQNNSEVGIANKTSYRYLKESLKDINKEIYCDMHKDIDPLISAYGNFSNKLHGKDIKINNETKYLQEILTQESIPYKKLCESICEIVDCYEIIMIKILKLNITKLSASEIFRITNFWNNDKVNMFLKTY
ncbi:hypothetical protein [Clostridium tetani]|uniref:hypothetical protein n=1 Tax=Clostridium tetani TaxID=1513 RepID=UPI0003C0C9B9|nr:hypothetical protein [Clostridium tetani]CDI49205.1 hypothetical protein BN906_01198 [Clostridium tetani 12124569]